MFSCAKGVNADRFFERDGGRSYERLLEGFIHHSHRLWIGIAACFCKEKAWGLEQQCGGYPSQPLVMH